MKHIVCFSGGKDSTALVLWAKENIGVPGQDFTTVFCDTGWEHPITYAYVEEINRTVLNGSLVTVKSEKYPDGFAQLCVERHGFPAVRRRYCTVELKVFPLHKYYESLDDGEIVSYQGIRADESASRSCMAEQEFVEDAGGYTIKRPLLRWSAEQCFEMMSKHGVKPNPLYLMGSTRVGCWPCIMTGLAELKRLLDHTPEIRQRLIDLEAAVNKSSPVCETRKWPSTFFKVGTIPEKFCSLSEEVYCRVCDGKGAISARDIYDYDMANFGSHSCNCDATCCRPPCSRCHGKGKYKAFVPTAEDVFRYIESVDENQLPLLPARTCMSVYNLCE